MCPIPDIEIWKWNQLNIYTGMLTTEKHKKVTNPYEWY